MNKFSISHSQNAVPTSLFATWEMDRSSPHSIPRMCSLVLGKLIIVKELDRDAQSVFVAVKMQGSKRVLRSNEIGLSSNGLLSTDLDLTFSLQYPHFIKRDGNVLQIMLQRKKRYKNRAMLGYKTLASANLDLSQIIQSPITEETIFELISTNKDRRNSLVVTAQVAVSSAYSTPADEVEVGLERADAKPTDADVENYTDDEETYSSDAEIGSDVNTRELFMDEDGAPKRKERRKHRLSSSSRQQNFIKAKLIALLRRLRKAEDEALETDMAEDPDANVPGDEELDFLYQEIEDLNLSDSCPEVEDNVSIVSTPKPKLRPFFDRVSHSSSQTELCSLRDYHGGEHNPAYFSQDSREGTLHKHDERETFESLQASDKTPAIDRSDSSDQEYGISVLHPAPVEETGNSSLRKAETSGMQMTPLPESPLHSSLPLPVSASDNKPKYSHVHSRYSVDGKTLDRKGSSDDLDFTIASHQKSLHVMHGTFSTEEDDSEVSQSSLLCPLILFNHAEKSSHWLAEVFQSYVSAGNNPDAILLSTSTQGQLKSIFSVLISKLQKFVNSNSKQPMSVKVVIAGNESYVNRVLQQFVDFLSSRSPEWMTYFLFLIVPLGRSKLGQYLASVDTRYAKLFNDQLWLEVFDKPSLPSKATTPTSSERYSGVCASFDGQANTERLLVHRVLEYANQASSPLSISVAEAMLTFKERSDNEGSSQKFIPFISEAKVGANEFLMQADSDREDVPASSTIPGAGPSQILPTGAGNTGSPASSAQTTSNLYLNPAMFVAEPKMGLQVDYWKDRDSTKYTLKTTFLSFLVSKLPTFGERSTTHGLLLDIVTIGKKNIMRLPGKKGKEKEPDSKSLAIPSINRIICTSKHQHNLLKVSIDGIEWTEVKFFQLSSHWPSHVKTFPVGTFCTH